LCHYIFLGQRKAKDYPVLAVAFLYPLPFVPSHLISFIFTAIDFIFLDADFCFCLAPLSSCSFRSFQVFSNAFFFRLICGRSIGFQFLVLFSSNLNSSLNLSKSDVISLVSTELSFTIRYSLAYPKVCPTFATFLHIILL
jgi:hypothetical protein